MNESTKIELKPEEAQLFILFRQHQDMFNALAQANLLEVRNGTAHLFFKDGVLLTIDFDMRTYTRKKVDNHAG